MAGFEEPFDALMTLDQAQAKLRDLVDVGAKCPCCTQFAKVYTRKINSGMARSLIAMYRACKTGWVHLPTQIGARSREEGKLRYWGLVEESLEQRPDGGRAGWWRVTLDGESFVQRRSTVLSHARIYDGRCLGLTGKHVTIEQCLGKKFSYQELMGG